MSSESYDDTIYNIDIESININNTSNILRYDEYKFDIHYDETNINHTPKYHTQKMYTCPYPYCGKVLSTCSGMLYHKNSVHLNKIYICNYCNKTYKNRSHYTNHVKFHKKIE